MIHVVLDTTVLRNDPLRRSSALKALRRLAMHGKLQIHISDISRREFITSRQLDFDSAIADTQKSIKKLRDIYPSVTECDEMQDTVEEIKSHRGQVSDEFENWLGETKAEVHPAKAEHGLAVLDAYFDGSPPFAQVKSRNDFPDAFIYQAVLALMDKVSPLHVISNDKNLREHVAKLEGVTAHSSVEEFVKDREISKLVQSTENLEWFTKFVTAADGQASRDTIAEEIEKQLPGHSVAGLPEDYEATIDSFGEIRELDLDVDSVDDYGDGLFSIPFTAFSECLVGFCIPKWVYYGIEEKHKPRSIEDWNDYVFRAEQYFDLKITGRVSFETEPGALDGQIRRMKEWAQILQAVEVEVEIDSIEVADAEVQDAFYS